MSRGGGRSEWEQWQAAQQREAQRQAREQAKRVKDEERRRRDEHLASQQQEAEEKTAALGQQVKVLDVLLVDSLSRSPLTFQQLKVPLKVSGFDPGPLGTLCPGAGVG